jgi:hypothetical protein
MPRRKTHQIAGTLAGAAYAMYRSRTLPAQAQLYASIGGALAGRYSGTWADTLEPAIHPRHRGPCHSVAFTAGGAAVAESALVKCESWFRTQADRLTREAQGETDPIVRCLKFILASLCHVLAGACAGIIAGYISHVALDMTTPRSVGFC